MSSPILPPAPDPAEPSPGARPGRTWRDYADAAVAQAALCLAQLRVWTRPSGGLVHVDAEPEAPAAAARASAADAARIERVAVAVDRASRRGLFRPQCLVRAIATEGLLRRARLGVEPVLRIGVRVREGKLDAHAWVECGGVVLDDDPRRSRGYAGLGSASPLG